MSKKLTFIEEAEFKGFRYRPDGILGNGFYGNNLFISLTDMEKYSRFYNMQDQIEEENLPRINSEQFINSEESNSFYTNDIVDLFPELKEHQLHNFLNRFRDVFLSQKLFSLLNRKRVFTKEAVKFIYAKLIRKENDQNSKKRGRKTN